MDRNTDRWWYDKGYSLGVTETQRDAIIPRLTGYWLLVIGAVWEPGVAGAYLGLYTVWTLYHWREKVAEAEHKRDTHNPGKEYAED